VCSSEDRHDHAAAHADLAERLGKRALVVGELNALVGRKGRVGLLRYVVTDCNIQIKGPRFWNLFVGWQEAPIEGGDAVQRSFEIAYDDPAKCASPAGVVVLIEAEVEKGSDRYAKAIRMVGEFQSE
jgi:hypothetical protein